MPVTTRSASKFAPDLQQNEIQKTQTVKHPDPVSIPKQKRRFALKSSVLDSICADLSHNSFRLQNAQNELELAVQEEKSLRRKKIMYMDYQRYISQKRPSIWAKLILHDELIYDLKMSSLLDVMNNDLTEDGHMRFYQAFKHPEHDIYLCYIHFGPGIEPNWGKPANVPNNVHFE
jgi:hypothetical protein